MAIVEKAELMKMKPGEKRIIPWSHPREFRCVQAACSDVSLNYPELNLRLNTKLNRQEKNITVIASEFTKKSTKGRKQYEWINYSIKR